MKTKLFIVLICLIAFASSAFAQMREAVKIEEFETIQCEEYLARMDNVIVAAKYDPNSRIYVFVYEGNIKEYKYRKNGDSEIKSVLPQRRLAKTKISSMKEYISMRGASLEGFVFMESGYRENFKVEFWIVPPGIEPPKPAPTLTALKYRKGKPQRFCLGCCEP